MNASSRSSTESSTEFELFWKSGLLLTYAVGAAVVACVIAYVYGIPAAVPLVAASATLFAEGERYRRKLNEIRATLPRPSRRSRT